MLTLGSALLSLLALPVLFGMAGATTQTVSGLYKTYYEDFVAEQTNNKFPFKGLFKWEAVEYAGQDVQYNAHVSRNISPMWVGEGGAFAEAGNQGSIKLSIGQRKLMARVRMTSEALQDSMRSKGAFRQARKDEMNRLIDDIARMEEYSITSDGRGVLALIDDTTPTTGTTITVDAPGGITGDDFGNRFFLPGMYVAADMAILALKASVKTAEAAYAHVRAACPPDASVPTPPSSTLPTPEAA